MGFVSFHIWLIGGESGKTAAGSSVEINICVNLSDQILSMDALGYF